jgi:AcrR family transcriptional regulator
VPTRRASTRRPSRARSRPRRRVRLDNDQRRAQLIALARRAFSEQAYDEVSVGDLAREAKISKGLLYHYFPTKRDLYVAGLTEIASQLVAAITAVPDDAPPIDRVRMGLDAYLGYVMEHSRPFVSLMRGGIGSDPEVAAVIEGVRTGLVERFLSGSPLAGMAAGDPKLELAIRGWIGFVEAVSIDWCANPRLARDELRELLARILFEILAVVVPGAPRA